MIIIVDSDKKVTESLEKQLNDMGHKTVIIDNADNVIAKLEQGEIPEEVLVNSKLAEIKKERDEYKNELDDLNKIIPTMYRHSYKLIFTLKVFVHTV